MVNNQQGKNLKQLYFFLSFCLDYFDQAIAESGSALASWALDLEPERHAREIAQRFGCENKDVASLKNCMQQKTATEIVDSHKEYYVSKRPLILTFAIIITVNKAPCFIPA